ncbi:MAG TPA: cytochrome c oxidase assembly protein [Gammaproteobacteria bacterium]|nr:cytochrome c oxidase assembly protein [Gammaproteobacteria bacterium]
MRRLILIIGCLIAAPAAAHGVGEAGEIHWLWEPWVLFCLAVTTVPYLIGLYRMGAEERRRIVGPARAAAFLAGIGILLIALESPLDPLADALFSMHMVQHLLLLLIVPPLLVSGRPVICWLWAFDLGPRRAIVRGWSRLGLYALFKWLTRPVVVWLLWVAVLCFWHLPGPYDASVRNEWLHDLEHLSFLGIALAYWTVVIEPYGRRRALGYGATMVYVVSAGFVMGMVAAILTLSPEPLYAVHLHTTQAFGFTPLEDQQFAGAIMWIPSNMIHLATICTLFFAWMREDERRAPKVRTMLSSTAMRCALIAPLVLVGLSGCGGGGGGGETAENGPANQITTIHLEDQQNGIGTGGMAQSAEPWQTIPGADPQRGAALILHYGCGSCHMIPGIANASGLVGPPLIHWSQRMIIAGFMRNQPENLIPWIMNPQTILPGVDMPNMNISRQEARDIAAYLYTID